MDGGGGLDHKDAGEMEEQCVPPLSEDPKGSTSSSDEAPGWVNKWSVRETVKSLNTALDVTVSPSVFAL